MKSNNFKKQNGAGLKIAIVRARFNEEITQGLLDGARRAAEESGIGGQDLTVVEVPGSFEVPLQVQRLVKSKHFQAVVALGAIIKGETKHDEYIAKAVVPALSQIGLTHDFPIILGIITPLNYDQAKARSASDQHNVGYQAVLAAIEVARLPQSVV